MGQAKIKRIKAECILGLPQPDMTDAQKAEAQALQAIHNRSFSGRHQDLGKMVNCKVCDLRHRESEVHKPKYIAVAGETPATESLIEKNRIRLTVGAAQFKGKRKRPPLNKRTNEFVQLVRSLLPNEYEHEELEKARSEAKRILAKKYGRHGFLPPVWQSRKEASAKKS